MRLAGHVATRSTPHDRLGHDTWGVGNRLGLVLGGVVIGWYPSQLVDFVYSNHFGEGLLKA